MNYVEMVVKAINDKGYTITQNPHKVRLKKECDRQVFLGSCIKIEYKSPFGKNNHTIFVSNYEDEKYFHNGSSILGNVGLPCVIWFKEFYDEITKAEGLFI